MLVTNRPSAAVKLSQGAFAGTIVYTALATTSISKNCQQGWALPVLSGFCTLAAAVVGMALDEQPFSLVAELLLHSRIYTVVHTNGVLSGDWACRSPRLAHQHAHESCVR